jgi:hypothetical protein
MLFHQGRSDVPIEVMRHPHLELVASNDHEMRALRATAEQLKQFGCVPFSYKEIEGSGTGTRAAVLRIAVCEREACGVQETCEGMASVNPGR